jgi:predicted nucleotidyltransferase
MNLDLCIPKESLDTFCRSNGIRRLFVLGSALRSDFRPDSDIDVLVEFDPERIPGLLGMAHLARELSALLGGRKVDLRTPQDISRYFRKPVLAAVSGQPVIVSQQ